MSTLEAILLVQLIVLLLAKFIILHCEFSTLRGPMTYELVRKKDRKINDSKYPLIFYPELYLLENGYKEFYDTYSVSKSFSEKSIFKH